MNTSSYTTSFAEKVREQIESNGEKIWRLADFKNMPLTAVAQTLSRLSRRGEIQRLGKGIYYRPRQTAFGQSKPNMSLLSSLPILGKKVFPAGNAAANLLGFSTQNPAKIEVATTGFSLPRLLLGKETIIHTRRPESWNELTTQEVAILDFLRNRGKTSELSPKETVYKLIEYLRKPNQLERLLRIAVSEPPRVCAILGAIGQEIGYPESKLLALRKKLNPLSRFDFGNLIALKYSKQWQAKKRKNP